jgi:hypothetical protein
MVRRNNIVRGENKMPKSKLPRFAGEQEAAEWFATHDTTPHMGELEEVGEPIPVTRSNPTKKDVELANRAGT